MIQYTKSCSVCQQIKLQPVLADEIYKTTAYDKTSKVSLQMIQKIYKNAFSYPSILNHVKKHQAITAEDMSQRHLNQIVKKAEKELVRKSIEAKDVWSTILDMGHDQIESGEIKLKASDVTRAAKDKSDYELKVKDQELAMIEMVYHFASGENKPTKIIGLRKQEGPKDESTRPIIEAEATESTADNDFTEELTGDTGPGEDGPSSVYYPPTWDATS